MEERLIKRDTLTDIADAIREKAGLQGHIPVKDYASNIRSLEKVEEYDRIATVDNGMTPTITDKYSEGYADGKTNGYNFGYADGKTNGYNFGYSDGKDVGYASGYGIGYDEGKTNGIEFGREEINSEVAEINNDLKVTLYGTDEGETTLEENVAQVGTDFEAIREVIRGKLGLAEDVGILPTEIPSKINEVYSAGYESLPDGDEVYY